MTSRRPWTTSERRRVAEGAGSVPAAELSRDVGRSVAAVGHVVRDMREAGKLDSDGFPPDLRYEPLEALWCDGCGVMRPSLYSTGECAVCRLREQLRVMREDNSAAWAELDADGQAHFDIDSPRRVHVAPVPPREPVRDAYARRWQWRRALRTYYAHLEAYDRAELVRAKNRTKRETSRIRAVLRGDVERGEDG